MTADKSKIKLIGFAGWTIVLILAYFFVKTADWTIDAHVHTIFESSATLIALIVSTLLLIGYYTNGDTNLLFLGIGFFGTALLDANHGLSTSIWFAEHSHASSSSSAGWTWNSSRLFLSLLMFLSCWKGIAGSSSLKSKKIKENKIYVLLGSLTLLVMVITALFPPLNPYSAGYAVSRPIELPPALFFLAALVVYLRRGQWKQDQFYAWLIAFLIASVFYQALIMPSSHKLFDGMFITAHLLKIVSYLFVFVGLASNTYSQFKEARKKSEDLVQINIKLHQEISEKNLLSEQLKSAARSLEERVNERTRELEDSRIAAYNMMEDANHARLQSERSKEELDIQASKLATSNRELEQFAYIASHDLQEPLRTVASFVQLLQQRYQGKLDEQANEYIQFVVEGVSRMRQLIDDLLQFSRVETKGGKKEPVDLEMIIGTVKANLKASLQENEVKLTHDPLPTIVADRVQISQVFQNLIGNAIKFRGERRPEIHIGLVKKDDDWLFSVRDNGIGVEQEFSEKIFVIFQRLHTRKEYPGTGIGLSICKKIIERHRGKIWIESTPGEGSTFYFTIPDLIGEENEHNHRNETHRNLVG